MKSLNKGFSPIAIVGVIGATVAVLGVGSYVVFNPNKVLSQSVDKIASAKSLSAKISAELKDRGEKLTGSVDLAFDVTDPKNPKIGLQIDGKNEKGEPLKLSFREIGEVIYIRLDLIAAFSGDVAQYKELFEKHLSGQWIRIDLKELSKSSKSQVGPLSISSNTLDNIKFEKIQRIKSLLEKSKIFENESVAGATVLGGKPAWQMRADLSPEGIASLMKELAAISKEPFSEKDAKEIASKIIEFNNEFDIKLTIGWDSILRGINISRKADLPEGEESILTNLVFELKEINQPLVIEAPASSRPIEEILQIILGQLFSLPAGKAEIKFK